MQLLQNKLQFLQNREPKVCGIFDQRNTLISSLMVNFMNIKIAPHDCDAEN